jgi:microcystin-dependent protein
MTLYKWSQTASADATVDSTINWAEGQAPSSVNDSARAMMAATAKYRDDIAGAIVTTGSSTAYAVSSYQVFDTLVHLSGQMIAFSPHITNAAGPVTLNVDGLGDKPLRTAPGVDLFAGTIIQGTPYVATYNNTDGAFYLQNFYGNPYNVPIGAGIDFWGTTAPNSSFVFPVGQAISRTIYATLFSMFGTAYGTGDGSTTFNLPDKRGRTSACLDNMGGSDAGRFSNAQSSMASVRTTLGGAAGSVVHTLTANEIPTIGGVNNNTQSFGLQNGQTNSALPNSLSTTGGGGGAQQTVAGTGVIGVSGQITIVPNTLSFQSTNTGGAAHENCQPTILCNYILRII